VDSREEGALGLVPASVRRREKFEDGGGASCEHRHRSFRDPTDHTARSMALGDDLHAGSSSSVRVSQGLELGAGGVGLGTGEGLL
jgi:hypothetical protein